MLRLLVARASQRVATSSAGAQIRLAASHFSSASSSSSHSASPSLACLGAASGVLQRGSPSLLHPATPLTDRPSLRSSPLAASLPPSLGCSSVLSAYTPQLLRPVAHPAGSSPLIVEAATYVASRVTSVFFAGAGVAWSYLKAREEWNKRSFLRRVNLSLNTFSSDGTLRIRTLFEKDIRDVFMGNTRAANIVLEAAKKTTLKDPILRLPQKESWFIYTTILNEISSMFATGHVLRDMASYPKPAFANKGVIPLPPGEWARKDFHARVSGGVFGVAPPSEQEIQQSLDRILAVVDSSVGLMAHAHEPPASAPASTATTAASTSTSQSVLSPSHPSPLGSHTPDSDLYERYCFALTREVASEVRFEKIRIMLVKESTLANWFKLFHEQSSHVSDRELTLESEERHQKGRWAALSHFAKLYHEQVAVEKANGGSLDVNMQHLWMRVALPLPVKSGY